MGAVRALRDLVLMVARIALGVVLVLRGWARWQGGMAAQADALSAQAIPQPQLMAWALTGIELVGGVLLVLGFLVPLVGLLLVAANVALIAWTQRGWQWRVTEGGWEYQVVLAAFGLVLLAFGGGRAGMDAMFRRRGDDPERKVVREHP
ncbi:MAG TPA: DoxX family protein [Candidatus Luteococcus avicola]|nr:DoxX family protein [Candidatus Luteococcus avicola]